MTTTKALSQSCHEYKRVKRRVCKFQAPGKPLTQTPSNKICLPHKLRYLSHKQPKPTRRLLFIIPHRMKKLLLAGLCLLLLQPSFCQLPPRFDNYVATVLNTFRVPGVSIAVVRRGEVLLAKGYGVKRMSDTASVDAHTLFPIASNTKAFTAMALAMLVEKGKIGWDDPVIKYLPWFRMSDAWVSSQLTIRDLLVHHSGIPAFAGDIFLFPPSSYTRREVIEKLKDIPLKHSFRTTYAYDNILYVVAGELITAVSGVSWEDFIAQNIFASVGMTESSATFSEVATKSNVATGHLLLHNVLTPVDAFAQQDIGDIADAAGGITSTATDMAKWMMAELDSGKTATQGRLIKTSAMNELWKVVTPITVGTVPEWLKPSQMISYGYALGVRVYNYGKYKVISHGGSLDGFVSHVLLVPDLKLGIAVLTNQETSGAYWSVLYHLLDYYMNNPTFDWIKGYKALLDSSMVQWQRDYDSAVVHPDSAAPKPTQIAKYTGKYHNAFYGDLTIAMNDSGGLRFQFEQTPLLTGRLEPFQYETFKATFNNACLRSDGYMRFTLSPDGQAESCRLTPVDPDTNLDCAELLFTKEKQ